ncbi:hypothetical protein PIB30_043884 [Stylosanthes scabra]|uniref:Uncharacterized protein n=1 Tax=Stylosanthes scabra TaxID=79078 RepID=A0ABU6SGI6_9FABA|nr:hypothetical protein [Stylosanthes scabra]
MRNSKIRSKRQAHAHSLGCYEDPRIQEQRKILQQSVYGNGFVIREVPIIQGLFNEEQCHNNNNNKNKVMMMDYDVPELVVFIQEDAQQFVKDIKVDREEDCCDLVHTQYHYFNDDDGVCENIKRSSSDSNLLRIMKRMSTISGGSSIACEFHHTFNRKRKSQTLEEAFRNDEEFSRSSKNWQLNNNSQPRTINNNNRVVEYPNQCSCPYCAQFTNTITIPAARRDDHEIWENSQSTNYIITGSQIDDFPQQVSSSNSLGPLSSVPKSSSSSTNSEAAISSSSSISAPPHHHQTNDSISSTHSFAFPILPAEWNGSPVRMAEAEKTKSRNCQWWKTCLFPCFKY